MQSLYRLLWLILYPCAEPDILYATKKGKQIDYYKLLTQQVLPVLDGQQAETGRMEPSLPVKLTTQIIHLNVKQFGWMFSV